MKLHDTNSIKYLNLLADYAARDSNSIEGWSCLILRGLLGESLQADKMQKLHEHLQDLEGAMVSGANGDLLIFFRGQISAGQKRLVTIVKEALDLEEDPESVSLDLALNKEAAAKEFLYQVECLRSSELASPIHQHEDAAQDKGIEYMSHVLDNSKFSRQYRSPMTVLLVEDDPITCRLVSNILSKSCVFLTAQNAYEAVVNYLIYAPDIVFLDINLPDDSGFNVLQQLTACDSDAYIVMFSGNDGIDNIIDARSHGAVGFIAKPFQRDRLHHYINEYEALREKSRSQ